MSESFVLSLLGGHIHVTCDVPGTAEWLRGIVTPAFALVSDDGDGFRVNIGGTASDPEPDATDLGMVPCFALDREVVHLPGRGLGTETFIEDEYFAAQYTVTPRRVTVRPAGRPRMFGASFRVVRELGVIEAGHDAQLHASGVADRGRVVLFAGPKEAGKTTLAASVAAATGAAIVANDRALVARGDGGWIAHGVPTIVHVRAATIALLPALRWPVPGVEQPVMSTLEEADWVSPAPEGDPSPLMLSLAQFARAAGAPLEPGGRLACVALVGVDDSIPHFTVRRLSPAAAERRLDAVRFGVHTEPRPATVFEQALGHGDAPSVGPHVVTRLAGEVPCVEVRVGRDFVATLGAAGALLEELLAHP